MPLGTAKSFLFYGNSEFWVQSKIDLLIKNNPSLKNLKSRSVPQELFFENKDLLSSLFFTNDFFAGPELILITHATDKITAIIEGLSSPSLPFFLVSAKDYLKPSSKLRKFYEDHPHFYSVPCYDLSAKELEKEIDTFFASYQKKISSDLVHQLAEFFYKSPDILKNELEKILSYMGSKETVESHDLRSSISSPLQNDLMDLINSFLDKNKKKTFVYLNSLEETGSFISILRMLGAGLTRLHQIKLNINSGGSFEQSIKTLFPPLLFNEQERFRKRLTLWSQEEMEELLKKIIETEISIKSNSKLARELFESFFLKNPSLV